MLGPCLCGWGLTPRIAPGIRRTLDLQLSTLAAPMEDTQNSAEYIQSSTELLTLEGLSTHGISSQKVSCRVPNAVSSIVSQFDGVNSPGVPLRILCSAMETPLLHSWYPCIVRALEEDSCFRNAASGCFHNLGFISWMPS